MTAITYFCDKKTKLLKGFEIKGHAGSADYGEDIVCASISIISINVQNSIEEFCDDDFDQDIDSDEGYMKFLLKDTPSHDASLLLASTYLGFQGIAEEYEKFVKLEIKEV